MASNTNAAALYDDADVAVANEETEARAPVSYSADTSGLDASDIARPILKLAQPLTPEVADGPAKVGKWFLDGENYDALTIIPRGVSKGADDKGNEHFTYEIYVVEAGMVATTRFRSSAIPIARELNAMALRAGGFGRFAVALGVTKKQNSKGSWHTPTVARATVDASVLETAVSALY